MLLLYVHLQFVGQLESQSADAAFGRSVSDVIKMAAKTNMAPGRLGRIAEVDRPTSEVMLDENEFFYKK